MSRPYPSGLHRKVLDMRAADENVKTVAVGALFTQAGV
jgi:hypothetical protein